MLEKWLWPATAVRGHSAALYTTSIRGAPLHYHREVRRFRDDQLLGSRFAQAGSNPWPPRLSDFNPPDLFLRYVKKTLPHFVTTKNSKRTEEKHDRIHRNSECRCVR
jgi:hypothetical protein